MSQIVLFTGVNTRLGFGRYAGTYRLATELRDAGFTVQTVDCFGDMPPEDVERIIDVHITEETLWVGFSTTLYNQYVPDEEEEEFWTNPSTTNLVNKHVGLYLKFMPYDDPIMIGFFDRIKQKNSNVKVVVGGYKAMYALYPGIDYWVVGQGEGPAVAISKHLRDKEPLKYVDTEVGRVITDKMYPYNTFSTSKIKWHESDHIFQGEDVPIELARGCIFRCSFCAFPLNGKTFGEYTKTYDSIRDEMLYNYENHGITGYMVSDDTINDSMRKIEYLHDILTSLPFKPRLTGYLRLDVLAKNTDQIKMLHEMGMSCANFGIETFNPVAAQAIQKPADPALLKETLYRLRDEWGDDVFTTANFMVGLPGESKESVRETFEWLNQPDVPLHGMFMSRLFLKQFPNTIQRPPLITEEQMRNYGFIQVPDGWQYTNSSEFQMDTEGYGYTSKDEKYWEWANEYMTWQEADELTDEFYSDPRNAHLKLNFVYPYNRMTNLGFSRLDVPKINMHDHNAIRDVLQRSLDKRDEYVNKLLQNPPNRPS